MPKKKKKVGRPSKYYPKIPEEMILFFSCPKKVQYVKSRKTTTKANGTSEIWEEFAYIANDLPTFFNFSRQIGVRYNLFVKWRRTKKEFEIAYNDCKELQKQFLVDNGLQGLHPPATYIFTAKNITDMRDKQELDHTSNGKEIVGFTYVMPKLDAKDNPNNKANV